MHRVRKLEKETAESMRRLKIRAVKVWLYHYENGKLIESYIRSLDKYDRQGRILSSEQFNNKGKVTSKSIYGYFKDGRITEERYVRSKKYWKMSYRYTKDKQISVIRFYTQKGRIKKLRRYVTRFDRSGNILESITTDQKGKKDILEKFVHEYIKEQDGTT
ncbi:MAG: hypothetical protein A2452_07370 [Candidatus Firestonebacteria bacterium RIFOXYC2_FULL_39_67]|nr:MAG: hypothetical protein A2452_07370 [Candidatus Firestonebacteria bacterium RIFOXYC2_FULL_39_67]